MVKCPYCSEQHEEHLTFCPNTGRVISPESLFPEGMMLEGKYRIGKCLGVGGMGAVFDGIHTLLNKKVAIKLLLPAFAKDHEMSARLMREARAASSTGHRNIVTVTDMGHTDSGALFLVMEHVAGKTLDAIIGAEAPLAPHRACMIASEMLAALEAVHRKGIIHRDLKPSNIILFFDDEGAEALKVLDFGLSKAMDDPRGGDVTTIGRVMGTPRYMSPEQAAAEGTIDHRTDIYSCGALLYEMLTGTPPLDAANYTAMIAMILYGTITPPHEINPVIGAELSQIVMRSLERSPQGRFVDAASFRSALRPFCDQLEEATCPGIGPQPPAMNIDKATLQLAPTGTHFHEQAQQAAGDSPVPKSSSADEELERTTQWQRPERTMELDPPQPRAVRRPVEGTLYDGRPRQGRLNGVRWLQWLRWLLILILASIGIAVIWHHRDHVFEYTSLGDSDDTILLLVQTDPSHAEVYVDGVKTVSKSVELPRSEREFLIRAQARGYYTETVETTGQQSRVVRIKLRKKRKQH